MDAVDEGAVLKDFVANNIGNLIVCHINARSILSNFEEFKAVFSDIRIDILVVTETWLNSSVNNTLVDLPGYTLFRNDRTFSRGGGVAAYVSAALWCREISRSSLTSWEVEHLFLEICRGNDRMLVGCVYRPPRVQSMNKFFESLSELCCAYPLNIICGDFNLNLLGDCNASRGFVTRLNALNLQVINGKPTRYHDNGSSLLDLLITNEPGMVSNQSQFSLAGISDHEAIVASFVLSSPRESEVAQKISYRSYKDINLHDLYLEASTLNWDNIHQLSDVDDQVFHLNYLISYLYEKYVPIKTYIPRYRSPWMNQEIETLMIERNQAYRCWRRNGGESLRRNFVYLRNKVTLEIRKAKKEYSQRKLGGNLSSRELWKNIKEFKLTTHGSTKCMIPPDELNYHFSASGSQGKSSCLVTQCNEDSYEGDFSFSNVSCEQVIMAIRSLKSNALGLDNIDLRFIKLLLPVIIRPLTHVLNTSITCSCFPEYWKRAKIIPIRKHAMAKEVTDFRPISILPVLSKVLERLLYQQITKYIDDNELLCDAQSGFRAKHSTVTALLHVVEMIRQNMDNQCASVLCLLDFTKAFDSVDINILCVKLRDQFKFSSTAVRFLHSYLSGRSQTVFSMDRFSDEIALSSGVPQGSILGPLLFCLYVNDLAYVPRYCFLKKYADDVQLLLPLPMRDSFQAIEKFNHDLLLISEWAVRNKLILNPLKTQAIIIYNMHVDTTNIPLLSLNNTSISFSESVRNLGVIFDTHLNWVKHIDSIVGKIYSGLRSLWYHASYTPRNTRVHLVKALLLPHITYADIVLGKLSSTCRTKLNVAYNACARYIYGLSRFSSVSSFSKSILGCTLDNYMKFRLVFFVFKIINNLCPRYLTNFVEFLSSNRARMLLIPRHRTRVSSNCFFIYGIQIWNNLPVEMRQLRSISNFRRIVFDYFSNC